MAGVDFQTLFQDAEANYQSGRIEDAKKEFLYLVDKAFETKKLEEALYFSYRLLLCKSKEKDIHSYISVLYKIAKSLLQSSALILADAIESQINLSFKVKLLHLLEDILCHLNEDNNLRKLQNMLYELYSSLIQEHDTSLEEKSKFAQQLLVYANKIGDEDLILESQERSTNYS